MNITEKEFAKNLCLYKEKKKYLIRLNRLSIENLTISTQVDNHLKVKFISDEEGGINVKHTEQKFNAFYQVAF